MALRQKINLPGFEWQVKEELRAVKTFRPPQEVEFRRGADPMAVVQEMLVYSSVKLCAAVGSGKSVKIPSALAATTKALVFHVLPNRQLVTHLYQYLQKIAQNGSGGLAPVDKYSGDVDFVPRNGVYLIAAVDMVDFVARHGDLKAFKGCSVYLDEAHESDAYTHTIRTLAVHLGAERLVQASATFNPVVQGVRATPGSVKMKQVELGSPDQWEVDRSGSPFQVATMRDGVLVFVDSRSAAKTLHVAYERAGLDVFRLTSESSDSEVSAAMHAAADKNGALFAILADYTYRSGFTFPVSRVVDTGDVSYYAAEPGEFKKLTRRMFQFEREQAAGRVGRIDGDAEYFYSQGECKAIMCDLEGVEKEAAAYIFRCLGFRPDGVLANAYMATHDLPSGISVRAALNGPYPLTYYVVHSGSAASLPANKPVSRTKDEVREGKPPSYVDSQEQVENKKVRPDGPQKRDSGYVGPDSGWESMLDEFANSESGLAMQDGVYYVSQVRDTARRGVTATMTFPSGLHSVREFARKKNFEFAVASLSREDRMWAFSALLDRYNSVTAQVKGVKSAVTELMTREQRSPGFVDKVRDILEELSADHADAVACLKAAEKFAASTSWAVPYDGILKTETATKEAYMLQLSDGHRSRGSHDLDEDIGTVVDAKMKRVKARDKTKGRSSETYDGRKHEVLAPPWLGSRRISYDVDNDSKSSSRGLKLMRRGHGHDDDGHEYEVVRRYRKVTTWY